MSALNSLFADHDLLNDHAIFNPQRFLLRLFILSSLVFVSGFFLFPTAKSLNMWFYLFVMPLILLNLPAISWVKEFKNPLLYGVGLYFFYCFVSVFWSAAFSIPGMVDVLAHIVYLLFFLCAIILLHKIPKPILWFGLHVFIVAASLSAVLSILVWYTHHPFNSRLEGLFRAKHPIQAVWAMSVPTIFCVTRFIATTSFKKSLIYFILALPLFAFVVLTQSRGPLIALVLAICCCLLRYRNGRSYLMLATIFLLAAFYHPLILRSFDTLSFRQNIWLSVSQQIASAPWFGHGYLAPRKIVTLGITFDHAHNVYLQMLFLGGFVGLILQSALMIATLWRGWVYRSHEAIFTLLIIFIFALICMLSDGANLITNPREVWLCFWLPLFAILTYPLARDHSVEEK